jgi:hypothetical protein
LLEKDEVREPRLEQEAALSMKARLYFERFPIPDRGTPVSADAAAQLFDSCVQVSGRCNADVFAL